MEKQFKPSPNAFKNTFCVFKEQPLEVVADWSPHFQSKSGSSYFYTSEGMYRLSNHWGRLANSKWRLETSNCTSVSKYKLGFAKWNEFYPDNPTEKLYYLEVDFEAKTVLYQHKSSPKYCFKAVVRTSFETTKKLKQIRNLLELTSWAKYFETDDIESLRRRIINELVYTEQSLDEIKRKVQAEYSSFVENSI